MNLFLLLCVVCLLINCSKCGPEIFKFSSQPVSQTVNSGGSVTLSCVATGRTGIKYSWYKLAKDFSIPPSNVSDLISGETNTKYTVQSADVDTSGERNLFQCKATAGSDYIFSNVATVKLSLQDGISFTGQKNENVKSELTNTGDDETDPYLWRLQCNAKVTDWNAVISNGKPYDVHWYKDSETTRVETNHKNMWTYYQTGSSSTAKKVSVKIADSEDYVFDLTLNQYDLVIFNVQTSDSGTYYCKAVSRGNQNSVTLGSTILTVKAAAEKTFKIITTSLAAGYVVLAVDDAGKHKSVPNVGDEVLLVCGGACRDNNDNGNWDISYKWRKGTTSSSPVVSDKREHIVKVDSAGQNNFRCEITNSVCGNPSAERVKFTVTAEVDPLLPFTFSKPPPKYMWYDTSDNSKSHDPFEIDCNGSISSRSYSFIKVVYKNGSQKSSNNTAYTFDSDIKSDKSGVYQCALYNTPERVTWYQNTTNVVIAATPTTSVTATSLSIQDGTTATFACAVGGYPIESVTITRPNSVNLVCPNTSGDVACNTTDSKKYTVTVSGFSATKGGQYTCTVQTRWYKTDGTDMGKATADTVTLKYVKESTTTLTASKNSPQKGDSVTLTCVVVGYPEPSQPTLTKSNSRIDWTKPCTGTNTKECIKTFSTAEYSDSGDYKCEGYNTIDGVNKTSHAYLKLTIGGNVKATLTQTPTGTELDKGSSVTFTCKAEGNPRPTKLTLKKGIQVLKSYDAAGGSDNDIVTNTYDISYPKTISSLALDDTATYTCEGENDNNGKKTDVASKAITVVSDVTVTLSASSTVPTFGSTLTITCTATGGRKPHSVELKRGSTPLKSYPSDSSFCSDSGSYSLKCTYLTTTDYTSGGSYVCIGKNNVKNNKEVTKETDSTSISISQSVAVTLKPSSETEVPSGTSFTITCDVSGGNQPHRVTLTKPDSSVVTWERASSGSSALSCSGTFELKCTYDIDNPVYSDEGQYICDGFNKLPGQAAVQTKRATVSLVLVKDVDVTFTKNITSSLNEVKFGDPFKITCEADGGRIPFYLEFSQTPSNSETVLYDTKSSKTPPSVKVSQEANTLTYIHTVTSADYDDIGEYSCLSKNEAASNAVKSKEKNVNVLVVKSVKSSIIASEVVKKGSALTITCVAEGYRPPHSVALTKDDSSVKNWVPKTDCTPLKSYNFTCVYNVTVSEYSNGGNYTCISKNYALGNKSVENEAKKTVQISQSVLTELTPNSEQELKWGEASLSITCKIEGGLQPHKATLEVPDGSTLTWNRNPTGGSPNNFACTGGHIIDCVHEVSSSTYASTGDYNCTGFNKMPSNSAKTHKMSKNVNIIVVKDVTASITSNPGSSEVNFGSKLNLTCKVEGGRTPFFLSVDMTPGKGTVYNIIKFDKTNQPDKVTRKANSLQYVHVIENVSYDNNGSYKCTGKNNAFQNVEKTDESTKNTVVVKDVEITQSNDIEADVGISFTFTIKVNGGRPPHFVEVKKGSYQILDKKQCTGTNEMICTKTVGDNDVNLGYYGTYTVTAKNRAGNNVEKTATKNFTVTVYKDVSAEITPGSDDDITYHQDKTITCKIDGGLAPYQVDLILPKKGTITWKRDGSQTSLKCSGKHELKCEYTFKAEYDSDGEYKCKGYNVARGGQKENESAVTLTTVRETEVNMSEDPISVVTNGKITLDCIIVGKPLVEKSSVSWKHDNDSLDLDLSEFVETVGGSEDNYTLKSTLKIDNPPVKYTGNFTCTATHNKKNFSKSVEVIINEREFLDPPGVTHSGGVNIKENYEMSITCDVEGFPRPTASLKYEDINGTLSRSLRPNSTKTLSKTSTKFEFKLTTSCEYSQYKFSCDVQNKKTNKELLNQSASVNGPVLIECGGLDLAAVIGGGVGGGVFLIIIIVLVVFFILKKARGTKERSYAPQNGTEFPNPAFSPDPSYATINDQARPGYSHLNRPVGPTDECGYSSIEQMKQNAVAVPVPGDDAYATLDTTSNGRLGHQRKGSDEAYAALNRPAPGKEKRGVIRKYKPIANRPKTVGMPPSLPTAGDFEMGETSHASPAEPTYATVNPDTMKPKAKASNYADITLPDVPPEVPVYGQMSDREPTAAPSEYADVTLPPLPPPPPDEPMYSNMGDRQEPTEDPVYAQVDFKSRTLKQPAAEETEELPPDVPVYGTMGELTVPNNPEEEEDPYATVEFVPKSKRKPPRPKVKEAESEGVYATITDIKENP